MRIRIEVNVSLYDIILLFLTPPAERRASKIQTNGELGGAPTPKRDKNLGNEERWHDP